MTKFFLKACSIILVFSLTGCMQQPRPTTIISKQARLQYLEKIQIWQAEGRLSIQNQNQVQTASYKWQQNKQNFRAYFFSPFANQSLTLKGDAKAIEVEAVHGMNEDEVELEQSLPLAQLGYWAKGMPAPTSTPQQLQYDSCNQLIKLQQDGWLIEYQSYAPKTPVSLPEKMTLRTEHIKVKLTIKR